MSAKHGHHRDTTQISHPITPQINVHYSSHNAEPHQISVFLTVSVIFTKLVHDMTVLISRTDPRS